MYWYSYNRSIQFNFNGQKVGGIVLSMDTGPDMYFKVIGIRLAPLLNTGPLEGI